MATSFGCTEVRDIWLVGCEYCRDPVEELYVVRALHTNKDADIVVWQNAQRFSETCKRGKVGRGKGTKASATRLSKIESKTNRLTNLDAIRRFVYSPTGDNRGRDALSHAEVLQIAVHMTA